jgi:hypothetical protein
MFFEFILTLLTFRDWSSERSDISIRVDAGEFESADTKAREFLKQKRESITEIIKRRCYYSPLLILTSSGISFIDFCKNKIDNIPYDELNKEEEEIRLDKITNASYYETCKPYISYIDICINMYESIKNKHERRFCCKEKFNLRERENRVQNWIFDFIDENYDKWCEIVPLKHKEICDELTIVHSGHWE